MVERLGIHRKLVERDVRIFQPAAFDAQSLISTKRLSFKTYLNKLNQLINEKFAPEITRFICFLPFWLVKLTMSTKLLKNAPCLKKLNPENSAWPVG